VGFYCTGENLGSRMKTFISVIDSYDEIIDFIFPSNLPFSMMNSSWCLGDVSFTVKRPSLVQSGYVGWKRWLERMEKLVEIQVLSIEYT
jgi:hypothetical protein